MSDVIKSSNSIALEAHDLTVSYGHKPVLWSVDFAMPTGTLGAIIGPNGAGKSTLLRACMGLLQPVSGYVKLFGESIDQVRQRVAYVPQRTTVNWEFPASVLEVVMMGRYGHLGLLRRPSKTDRQIAWDALEEVGLTTLARRQISQLSGGQQQRVFLARSIAQGADLYLFDEPFVGVDMATTHTIVEFFGKLRAQGKTVLVVLHDLGLVPEYFDWSLMLNLHMVAAGPTKEVFTDDNLQTAFGGRLTLLSQVGHRIEQEGLPPRDKKTTK